jgi:hypothetical protein
MMLFNHVQPMQTSVTMNLARKTDSNHPSQGTPRRSLFKSTVGCGLLFLFALFGSIEGNAAPPAILITNLPSYGSTEFLAGKVLSANPTQHAVAVYIYVPGYGWVTKPTCAQPLTPIKPDGSWRANIVSGGSDASATRVAAFLVGTNFNQGCVLGLANLPTNLYAQALAKTVVTRATPGVRRLSFSGYDWWVKTGFTPVGPGPNYFSDSTNNVWIDAQGWLHLRITHRSNQWQCAEIVSARTFGPGNYRFELGTAANSLDPKVTLGLFTWSDDPAFTYREIDVECSRWGDANDINNAQFVVQPYDQAGHLARYRVPPGVTNSTHCFVWETNRIRFQAFAGPYSDNQPPTNQLAAWVFSNTAAVPQSGDENVRLNLWLQGGQPPTDSKEVEVVVKSVEFVPLEAPTQALLHLPRLTASNGPIQFSFTTIPDFRYQVRRSTNFEHWEGFPALLATDTIIHFQDTNPPSKAACFYQVVTQP